jgi:hypothetical protein
VTVLETRFHFALIVMNATGMASTHTGTDCISVPCKFMFRGLAVIHTSVETRLFLLEYVVQHLTPRMPARNVGRYRNSSLCSQKGSQLCRTGTVCSNMTEIKRVV